MCTWCAWVGGMRAEESWGWRLVEFAFPPRGAVLQGNVDTSVDTVMVCACVRCGSVPGWGAVGWWGGKHSTDEDEGKGGPFVFFSKSRLCNYPTNFSYPQNLRFV